MITLKLTNLDTNEKIKKSLPVCWDDLTLEMFCRLMDCYEAKETPSNFEIVSALLDIPLHWIENAKLKDIDGSIFYYLEFLQDGEVWQNIWNKPPKITEIDGLKIERIDDISEVLTLGEKEEILQAFKDKNTTYLQKSVLVLRTVYKQFKNVNLSNQAAIRIFPLVAFFLNNLKNLLILGRLRLAAKQPTKNTKRA